MTKRQQAIDVAIAAVVAFGCTLEVWAPKDFGSTHMTGPRAAVYVSYLVAAGALAFRRRFPFASCVVVSAALSVEWLIFGAPEGFGVFATLVIAGYSVAAYQDLTAPFSVSVCSPVPVSSGSVATRCRSRSAGWPAASSGSPPWP